MKEVGTTIPPHSPELRRIEGLGTDEGRWRAAPVLRDLPVCDIDPWATTYRRIWMLAPHPDDEILGLGAALSRLSTLHANLCVVSVTDGEASHPGSRHWTPDRLATARRSEMEHGLAALGIEAAILRLSLPDGGVGGHRDALLKALADVVDERDLLLTTCGFDGHPDHEACSEVATLAAELTGATVFEYPVWMWHWASPEAAIVPWSRARQIPVDDETLARKRAAIQSFTSQIERDERREAILPSHVIRRFLRPFEVVFV